MKTINFCLALLFMAAMTACSSDDEKNDGRQEGGKEQKEVVETTSPWTKVTGCLEETRGMFAETITVEARENGQLYFKNGNAYFCCEHEKLTIAASVNGKTISITEQETGPYANCICPYDLECLVEGLKAGDYEVVVMRDNLEKCRFNISYSSTLKQSLEI